MRVELPYGPATLTLNLPGEGTDVLLPTAAPALEDEHAAFLGAVERPVGTLPLRALASGARRACLVISDMTRPTPNHKLVPWLLRELHAAGCGEVTVLVGTGSHQPHTPEQCRALVGEPLGACRLLSHNAYDRDALVRVGITSLGPVWLHRSYVEADLRVVTGFIEPHFFAGYSGGGKGIMPGIAGIDTILSFHCARLVGDPATTWLELDNNPTQQAVLDAVQLCPPHFLVNVTLDDQRAITGVFAGHWQQAHRAGTAFCGKHATIPVTCTYPVVLVTNGGHPLDQNLYQTVKGMSAAARITSPGGNIVVASACSAGIPDYGNFRELLWRYPDPSSLLQSLPPGPAVHDQWEAQVLAGIVSSFPVHLYSELAPEVARRCWLQPVDDLESLVQSLLSTSGPGGRLAVLPRGPLAVPMVAQSTGPRG
ncbi:MAG: nickel-dependent lactate racemase [Bacillota bacterium]